jgi:hypothetical protein
MGTVVVTRLPVADTSLEVASAMGGRRGPIDALAGAFHGASTFLPLSTLSFSDYA